MVTGWENPYVMQLKDEFGWTEARMLNNGWLKFYPIAQPRSIATTRWAMPIVFQNRTASIRTG